jgi:hypothetical protein
VSPHSLARTQRFAHSVTLPSSTRHVDHLRAELDASRDPRETLPEWLDELDRLIDGQGASTDDDDHNSGPDGGGSGGGGGGVRARGSGGGDGHFGRDHQADPVHQEQQQRQMAEAAKSIRRLLREREELMEINNALKSQVRAASAGPESAAGTAVFNKAPPSAGAGAEASDVRRVQRGDQPHGRGNEPRVANSRGGGSGGGGGDGGGASTSRSRLGFSGAAAASSTAQRSGVGASMASSLGSDAVREVFGLLDNTDSDEDSVGEREKQPDQSLKLQGTAPQYAKRDPPRAMSERTTASQRQAVAATAAAARPPRGSRHPVRHFGRDADSNDDEEH